MKILLTIISELTKLASTFSSSIIADAIEEGTNRVKGQITKILISTITLGIGILLLASGIGQVIDAYLKTTGIGYVITGALLIIASAILIKN